MSKSGPLLTYFANIYLYIFSFILLNIVNFHEPTIVPPNETIKNNLNYLCIPSLSYWPTTGAGTGKLPCWLYLIISFLSNCKQIARCLPDLTLGNFELLSSRDPGASPRILVIWPLSVTGLGWHYLNLRFGTDIYSPWLPVWSFYFYFHKTSICKCPILECV